MSSKLGSHHLNQIFKRVFKIKKFDSAPNADATLEILFDDVEGFTPPCNYSNTYVFTDRVPIFADKTLHEKSDLCQSLMDNSGETCIVADSVMSSLNALHFVTITQDFGTVDRWINLMNPANVNLYADNITEQDIIVIAKLRSFIKNYA